ncbi:MAG: DUF6371 domain-containing protein [Chitinophagaceae bacterium]
MAYRYTLEPYKGMNSRYNCPACGKHKKFTRYIDTETGNHLGEEVGKCSREINCGYHFKPKQYFEKNKPLFNSREKSEYSYIIKRKPEKANPVSFIPFDTFKQSLGFHKENNFIQFLYRHFGSENTSALISRYYIGTSKHWDGATVFWQIDINRKIRSGKIMLYNAITGKRSKEQYHMPTWVHSVLRLPEFALKQCFFGEHLLHGSTKPVAICESEKTAIIASFYFPEFVWLACGALGGLNPGKSKVLQGRSVVLYPDLRSFDKWQAKAKELSSISRFVISDLLERKATENEKAQGLDLADYLLRFPVKAIAPIHLYSTDIIALLCETHTGKDFNELIIACIKTQERKVVDLLVNKGGDLITPGEQDEAVNHLASFFEKPFQIAFFDNTPCWVHTDSRFDNFNN